MTAPRTPDVLPEHLREYDEGYFTGARIDQGGFDDYHNCRGVLTWWTDMLQRLVNPTSLLDVGTAYAFPVEILRDRGVPAYGIEPSAFALSQVRADIKPYVLQGALPDLPVIWDTEAAVAGLVKNARFDVVTCNETLEHVPPAMVDAALASLADYTNRLLIACIDIVDDGKPGHLCMRDARWWNARLDATGLVRRQDLENAFNAEPLSIHMKWSGRFFIREYVPRAPLPTGRT